MRALSKISPDWWDYTTLDREILDEAAKINIDNLKSFERPGFKINIFDTYQEFYCAEALEYIDAWKKATPDNPCELFRSMAFPIAEFSPAPMPLPVSDRNKCGCNG